MKANLIRFEIGAPRVGWTQVSVESGDFHWKFLASYTPWDSIADFANAGNDLISGRSAQVKWHLEPGVFVFRFHFGGGRSTFEILEFVDRDLRRPPRPDPIPLMEFGTKTLASAVWRSLRRLEGTVDKETYAKEWRGPFPTEAVKQLGAALRQKKSSSENPE
jgi:hypothetical protein